MRVAGLNFSTMTMGFPEHPDVRIGREVARILGVRHRVDTPATTSATTSAPTVSVDPVRRAWNSLRLCDGMMTAYEHSAGGQRRFRPGRPAFDGVGGEMLRGGLAHGWGRRPAEQVIARVGYLLLPDPWILTPDARRGVELAAASWRDQVHTAPLQVLADYHRLYKVGRLAAATRNCPSLTRAMTSVLMDNAMIRVVAGRPVAELHDERVVAAALGQLNPALQRLVFCAERWDFERDHPSGLLPEQEWADRAPLPLGTGRRSGYNWRLSYGPNVAAFFRRTILADRTHPLFDVVDWSATRNLLHADARRPKLVWNLYTAHFLLGNGWLSPTPAVGDVLTVPVPAS
ncbi:MAG: hypothetical protein DLM56_14695 [Pseudonocardiales bacterium]|nr:MAG: hypothetical protein DLM56_14695 [Pseudonocardiales bacterium]